MTVIAAGVSTSASTEQLTDSLASGRGESCVHSLKHAPVPFSIRINVANTMLNQGEAIRADRRLSSSGTSLRKGLSGEPTCGADIVQHRVSPDLCIDRFDEGSHFERL